MKSSRRVLSAVVLLAAVLGTTTLAAYASQLHPICAARQHECGQTPKISGCCCGSEQADRHESARVQSRVEVRVDFTSMPAVLRAVQVAMTPHAEPTVHTSPPHRYLVDLPTLFSSLLI